MGMDHDLLHSRVARPGSPRRVRVGAALPELRHHGNSLLSGATKRVCFVAPVPLWEGPGHRRIAASSMSHNSTALQGHITMHLLTHALLGHPLKGDLFDRSAYIADKARERAAGVVAFLRWFALGLRTGHALAAPDALLGLRCVPLRKREWVML